MKNIHFFDRDYAEINWNNQEFGKPLYNVTSETSTTAAATNTNGILHSAISFYCDLACLSDSNCKDMQYSEFALEPFYMEPWNKNENRLPDKGVRNQLTVPNCG